MLRSRCDFFTKIFKAETRCSSASADRSGCDLAVQVDLSHKQGVREELSDVHMCLGHAIVLLAVSPDPLIELLQVRLQGGLGENLHT